MGIRLYGRSLALLFTLAFVTGELYALPPLGLRQITPAMDLNAGLEIIDGTAYLNVENGIWSLDSTGGLSFVPSTKPTPVVKAYDGGLYFASNEATGPVLRRFDQPSVAITSWDVDGYAVGVDSQLRVLGNLKGYWGSDEAVEFLPGGCVADVCTEFLPGNINGPYLYAVTPQGYALGDGGIPGTIGSSPALWGPDSEFIGFPFGYDIPGTIRDRGDGTGVNLSTVGGELIFGANTTTSASELDRPDYFVLPQGWLVAGVLVSHGDFVVAVDYDYYNPHPNIYAFYPGIYDDYSYGPVPLIDIFPQLASIDINAIASAASLGGYLYLTIRGSDGLYLFGARDPSVTIPEPAALTLLASVILACVVKRPAPAPIIGSAQYKRGHED